MIKSIMVAIVLLTCTSQAAVLWVSNTGSGAGTPNDPDDPWQFAWVALAAAGSGDWVVHKSPETYDCGTNMLNVPHDVNYIFTNVHLRSGNPSYGGFAWNDRGVFLNPGNNSIIDGAGGSITCTNSRDDETGAWAGIGGISPHNKAYTGAFIRNIVVSNAQNDVIFGFNSLPAGGIDTTTVHSATWSNIWAYETFWDAIAFGGAATATNRVLNSFFHYRGTNDMLWKNNGISCFLRDDGLGYTELQNTSCYMEPGAAFPMTYISAGLNPLYVYNCNFYGAGSTNTPGFIYWFRVEEIAGANLFTSYPVWPPRHTIAGWGWANQYFTNYGPANLVRRLTTNPPP